LSYAVAVKKQMLVQVKYSEQQKYVKLDCIEGRVDFMRFHLKVLNVLFHLIKMIHISYINIA